MTRESRLPALLGEGVRLLERGRAREAADVFSRVLLLDASHAEARDGLSRARAAAAEQDRILDAKLDEARRVAAAGDRLRARALIDEVLFLGGDRDRALDLLDRLDAREGRIESPSRAESRPRVVAVPERGRQSPSRRALVVAWVVGFALLAGGVVGSWERLVDGLVRPPSPTTGPVISAADGAPPAGSSRVAEARRLIERGDLDGARVQLDRILPGDPAYPLARRLRTQLAAREGEIGP